MDLMQTQINKAKSSAVNDRVIPEIQNIMGSVALNRNGPELGTSLSEVLAMLGKTNTKFAKKDSMSACDLEEDTDFTPYNSTY